MAFKLPISHVGETMPSAEITSSDAYRSQREMQMSELDQVGDITACWDTGDLRNPASIEKTVAKVQAQALGARSLGLPHKRIKPRFYIKQYLKVPISYMT